MMSRKHILVSFCDFHEVEMAIHDFLTLAVMLQMSKHNLTRQPTRNSVFHVVSMATSLQRPLSSVPNVAIEERLYCIDHGQKKAK